jgi:hypothetical protein
MALRAAVIALLGGARPMALCAGRISFPDGPIACITFDPLSTHIVCALRERNSRFGLTRAARASLTECLREGPQME